MCIINRVRPVLVLICLVFLSARAEAGSKIKYYFNRAVDTSVSSGVNAIYLNNCIADTLTAYLNRAKYSLDICMYDFEKTYSYNINIGCCMIYSASLSTLCFYSCNIELSAY